MFLQFCFCFSNQANLVLYHNVHIVSLLPGKKSVSSIHGSQYTIGQNSLTELTIRLLSTLGLKIVIVLTMLSEKSNPRTFYLAKFIPDINECLEIGKPPHSHGQPHFLKCSDSFHTCQSFNNNLQIDLHLYVYGYMCVNVYMLEFSMFV